MSLNSKTETSAGHHRSGALELGGGAGVRDSAQTLALEPADPLVPPDELAELALLSPRELEITRCVAKGFSNKETARLLGISHWTVAAHLKASFLKLGVKRRSELAFLMRRIL